MSYIEREALLKKMLGLHSIPVYIGHVTDEDKMFETMVEVVEEQPTADVVPVVRCKDCKHCEHIYPECDINGNCREAYYCKSIKGDVKPDDYCCWGERRCEE